LGDKEFDGTRVMRGGAQTPSHPASQPASKSANQPASQSQAEPSGPHLQVRYIFVVFYEINQILYFAFLDAMPSVIFRTDP
jgi:hypothetical protein